jgi:hypothetical protein
VNTSSDSEGRLQELLSEQTSRRLTTVEMNELSALLSEHRGWYGDDLEIAAAAISLALEKDAPPPIPFSLRQELQNAANQFHLSRSAPDRSATVRERMPEEKPGDTLKRPIVLAENDDAMRSDETQLVGDDVVSRDTPRMSAPRVSLGEARIEPIEPVEADTKPVFKKGPDSLAPKEPGFDARRRNAMVSLAACTGALIAASLAWITGWRPFRLGAGSKTGTSKEARQALLARAHDVEQATWSPGPDASGKDVAGDIVWSGAAQQGFVRVAGLPVEDPASAQYQLWIFDAERDERYPVDGGVFDIPSVEHETIIPIRARIRVTRAVRFTITLEAPGGVVVSNREHVVAVAKLH